MSKETVKELPRYLNHDEVMEVGVKVRAKLTDEHTLDEIHSILSEVFEEVRARVDAEPPRYRVLHNDIGEVWMDADTLVKLRDTRSSPSGT